MHHLPHRHIQLLSPAAVFFKNEELWCQYDNSIAGKVEYIGHITYGKRLKENRLTFQCDFFQSEQHNH